MKPRGLLFIIDPHATRRRPYQRVDENFLDTTLFKLSQAIDIANLHQAVPCIPGDLVSNQFEDAVLVSRLLEVLRRACFRPRILMGNHDCKETRLVENSTLSIVRASGVTEVIIETGSEILDLKDGKVLLGGTPYGHEIPKRIERGDCLATFWMTHEDMAFPGSYPGAKEFFEIVGCDHVINGHMHLPQNPVKVGGTTWHNPGNIVRLTKTEKNRVPKVLFWQPKDGFRPISLAYNCEAFLPNVDVPADTTTDAKPKTKPAKPLEFVRELKQDMETDWRGTDNADHLRQLIELVCQEQGANENVQNYLEELLERALAEK